MTTATEPRVLQQAWAAVRDDRWVLLGATGAGVAGMARFVHGEPGAAMVIGGLTAGGVGAYLQARRQRLDRTSTKQLEADLDEARATIARQEDDLARAMGAVVLLPDDAMFRLHAALELGTTGRASLFLAVDDRTCRLVGRHSASLELAARPRDQYRLDSATCISQAWREGACEVVDLPSPGGAGKRYAAAQLRQFGVVAEVLPTLSMRSRSYAARRLLDDSGRKALGVVVIESKEPRGASLEALDAYLDHDHTTGLSVVLQTLTSLAPADLAAVRDAGF